MSSRTRFLESSVGSKILIGFTGLALVIYLCIHISANLTVFGGPAFFNGSADMLERLPVLPLIELALLAVFVLHIYRTVRMYLGNRRARPVAYAVKTGAGHTSRKTVASSTMIVSGLTLLAFLVIHVKAFRFGPHYDYEGMRDFYRLEVEALTNPLMAAFYVLSMVVVGSHLWHGGSSALQSLGLDHPTWTPRLLVFTKVLAVAIAGGFIAITIWVYLIASGVIVL
jgi:succinate dehydrogenase / fumarate reductase cytochrome b subunit